MRIILVLAWLLVAGANAAEPYSPPLKQDYPDNVFWGDNHVHMYLSPNAFPSVLPSDIRHRYPESSK